MKRSIPPLIDAVQLPPKGFEVVDDSTNAQLSSTEPGEPVAHQIQLSSFPLVSISHLHRLPEALRGTVA
jgi:hypothetical protein